MSSPDTSIKAPTTARGGRASSALLKLQADERLVAHVRRGNEAAFEVLVQRYHTRLLAFCRHMLGSGARRDAEDVLQEVFASAYRAMLGDTRPINVRPWLYRIARNRCLNHLRRDPMPSIEGMELTVVDERIGTEETVHQRAEVRQLLSDIQNLPETQRTAILLREIDDLSYEQIAMAMDNTVASVKSLLVRARVGLAEAAESRRLSCDEVRFELGQHSEGLIDKLTPPTRRHLKECKSCAAFQQDLKDTNKALAMLAPAFGLVVLLKAVLTPLGGAGGAGTAGAAGAGAAAGASGGIISIGGVLSAKTMTGLAAAVAVTGAAVEVKHVTTPARPATVQQAAAPVTPPSAPTSTNPSGGVAAATLPPTGSASASDRPAATTVKEEEPEATSPTTPTTPTTVTVALDATTPEVAPTTAGTTPTVPAIEERTGTAELPDIEDRADETTVRPPLRLPVPLPPSMRPRPSTPTQPTQPAPTQPAPSQPAPSQPAPQPQPEPTPAPEPTPQPTPTPTPTPTPSTPINVEQIVDAVAPTTGD